jgi:hypothetical protein
VNNWIFLSKGMKDPYINEFARGCGTTTTDPDNFVYDSEDETPICLRGILKKKIMHKCFEDNRTFYYMDTGYFGNEVTASNPNGWKYWHRIVKNNLAHGDIIQRPDDRFKRFNKKFEPWKKDGRKILIAAPDEKPCKFYNIDLNNWMQQTVNEIKKYTDRPIEIRQRDKTRLTRLTNTLEEALDNDVFALVTFNSNAAVESVFHGIPVFPLAPANAASPMGLKDLSKIDSPYYPDDDTKYAWGCHLAYGQYHVSEMRTGKAKELLETQWT